MHNSRTVINVSHSTGTLASPPPTIKIKLTHQIIINNLSVGLAANDSLFPISISDPSGRNWNFACVAGSGSRGRSPSRLGGQINVWIIYRRTKGKKEIGRKRGRCFDVVKNVFSNYRRISLIVSPRLRSHIGYAKRCANVWRTFAASAREASRCGLFRGMIAWQQWSSSLTFANGRRKEDNAGAHLHFAVAHFSAENAKTRGIACGKLELMQGETEKTEKTRPWGGASN